METTTLTDEQIRVYKSTLTKLLKIKDYQINDLQFLPNSGKFTACIEIHFNGKTYIRQTSGKSIVAVADNLNDQYAGMVFCVGTGAALRGFSQKIERYFLS